ncbi:MAG: transglycosylase SLT domain-containing protein, partial [Methylococcales bacterium]|nr:transglycosylase SLT domain-containing protein [Methylococcales bacterium]
MSNSAKANKRKYSAYVAQSARKYNVDQRLVHAVILAESAYNPNARSPVGAVGLMQLMPAT